MPLVKPPRGVEPPSPTYQSRCVPINASGAFGISPERYIVNGNIIFSSDAPSYSSILMYAITINTGGNRILNISIQ